MIRGDISNVSPPTTLVHVSCFLRLEVRRRLIGSTTRYVPDALALNRLWQHAGHHGTRLVAFWFDGDPKPEPLRGFDPFVDWVQYPDPELLARELPFRPDVVAVFDNSRSAYGKWSRRLERLEEA